MSRDWLAVYSRLIHLPKFRHLPDGAQLTLFYVWCLAGDQMPEATWPSANDLGDALSLYGRLSEGVDALVAARWLDVLPDGAVTVHDWDEHQLSATKAARNAYEARYMRTWRRRRKDEPAPATSTGQDKTVHNRSEQLVSNGLATTIPWGPEWGTFLDAWTERFPGRVPSDGQRKALWPIVDARPNDAAEWVRGVRATASPFEVMGEVLGKWALFRSGVSG